MTVQQYRAPGGPRRLWQFHGGIHVPDEKALSSGAPLVAAPLPDHLVIPLRQHIGNPARPVVEVGQRVLTGQRIAEPQGFVSASVHAGSSGTVVAIEERPVPHPSGLTAPCIVIATDGRDEWAPLAEPLHNYKSLEPQVIRERIRAAGVVGMGGASFPASVKLSPGSEQRIRTLIINGAECEPYITCDDLLMRERAEDVVLGARIMRHLLGAEECLIGIEDNKPEAIAAMRQAVAQSETGHPPQVIAIPTLYPSGGERQLIKILTGREVPTHGIPAQIGMVVQNVGTCAAVADAVLEGRPAVSRYVTMSGRGFAHPCNLEVRVGTPIAHLIAEVGGITRDIAKLLLGGPMMGFTLLNDQVPITKAVNCVLALTPEEAPDPGPALACIRCGRCAAVCPANLLPQQLYWHARAKDLDKAQDYSLFDCIECGCCAHVCPSHIPLVQYYRFAKNESWAREQDRRAAEHARERHQAKEARLARQEREREAKQRQQREAMQQRAAAKDKATPSAATPAPPADAADPKQAMIEAARQRAAAKRAALAEGRPAGESAPAATTADQE